MALNITYRKGALAQLADELPNLLFAYGEKKMQQEQDLLRYNINKNEREVNRLEKKYEQTADSLKELTGVLSSLPSQNKSGGNVASIVDSSYSGVATTFKELNQQLINERSSLETGLKDLNNKFSQAKALESFYAGAADNFEGGVDPERFDLGDFELSGDAFKEYAELYGIGDVEKDPYLAGVKARKELDLEKKIASLNLVKDTAELAALEAATNLKVGDIMQQINT